jgi:hypothetical protein
VAELFDGGQNFLISRQQRCCTFGILTSPSEHRSSATARKAKANYTSIPKSLMTIVFPDTNSERF